MTNKEFLEELENRLSKLDNKFDEIENKLEDRINKLEIGQKEIIEKIEKLIMLLNVKVINVSSL